MSFSRYVQERWKTVALLLFAIMTVEIFLLVYHVHIFLHIYIVLVLLAAFLLGTFAEYYSKKNFYEDILGKLEQLEEKYLIVEMLESANFTEEKLLRAILQEAGKAMTEQVNAYRYIQEE